MLFGDAHLKGLVEKNAPSTPRCDLCRVDITTKYIENDTSQRA